MLVPSSLPLFSVIVFTLLDTAKLFVPLPVHARPVGVPQHNLVLRRWVSYLSGHVTPDSVFNRVGVDYVRPVYINYGFVRKPTIIKAHVCVFVSLSVKAMHFKLVSNLGTNAFIASTRHIIARHGKSILVWSDHGSNFVGVALELAQFLESQKTQVLLSEFCSSQNIQLNFIPEHAPHFGGILELAVKSMKTH